MRAADHRPAAWILALLFIGAPTLANADGFTYHGRLSELGVPAEGRFDLELMLYDDPVAGRELARTTRLDVPVSGGSFKLLLDFGDSAVSEGGEWVETRVRRAGSGLDYRTLTPRQQLVTTSCQVTGDLEVGGNVTFISSTPSPARISAFYSGMIHTADEITFCYWDGPGTCSIDHTFNSTTGFRSWTDIVVGDGFGTTWTFRKDGVLFPDTDRAGRIGGDNNEVGDIYVYNLHAVNSYAGDAIFANEFRITEREGAPLEAMVFQSPSGEPVLALDESGTLEAGGYVKLDLTSGAPPKADCDDPSHHGRMKVDAAAGRLWICAARGWVGK